MALSDSNRAPEMKLDEAGVSASHAGRDTVTSGPERSYQRLANEIALLISSSEFAANDRLPSERILAERFGVSRTSIREAIIALEIRGAVEVKGGSGIYVRGLKPFSFLAETSTGPFELLRGT